MTRTRSNFKRSCGSSYLSLALSTLQEIEVRITSHNRIGTIMPAASSLRDRDRGIKFYIPARSRQQAPTAIEQPRCALYLTQSDRTSCQTYPQRLPLPHIRVTNMRYPSAPPTMPYAMRFDGLVSRAFGSASWFNINRTMSTCP